MWEEEHAKKLALTRDETEQQQLQQTVTWPGPASNQLSTQLQERLPGGSWSTISSTFSGQGSIYLVRSPGTYEYRTRAVEEFYHNQFEPDIRFVFSTPITVNVVPGPPIPLDDFATQFEYDFSVRAGDWNGDGLTDLYIRRLDGNPDNGVFSETLLRQAANGRFTVLPPDAGMYGVASAWPEINVNTRGTDGNLDGYLDLEIWNFPAGTNIQYPQTVYSTGLQYTRHAKSVSTADEDVQMFLRDLEAASRNRNYFDAAGEPDQPGYRIDLVLEYGYCIYFYWFPVCATYRYSIFVGEFTLPELGLASSSSTSSDGVQKMSATSISAMPSYKANSISSSIAQKAATEVDVNTVGGSALPSSYVGSETQKAQAAAHFGIQNPWPETLVCVIWCNLEIYYFYGGYEYFAWYDVWTPTTIEGTFDSENYSETAFQLVEGEWDWQRVLKNGPQASRTGVADGIRRVLQILIGVDPEPVEVDVDGTVFDPDTWEGAARGAVIVMQRIKNALMCKFKSDPEECLAAIEDDILEDWEDEGGGVVGVLGPGRFDEDNDVLRDSLPLMGATIQAVSKPGRWQCSYLKKNLGQGLFYYGITSTVASGNCVDAVAKRSATHDRSGRFEARGLWQPSRPDAQTNAGATIGLSDIIARGVIRGREQQLIDSHVWLYPGRGYTQGLDDTQHMFNRIRSIARDNDLGCAAWLASTGTVQILTTSERANPAGPYTGYMTCPGAPTP